MQSQVFVHRLVAYLKFGRKELFKDGIVVRHLDDIKHNNSWINIDIGTHEDNRRDEFGME
ncbi:HNH endonuclease [Paenibacillus provencensis]|uniref:HNH endonuclease n=1 Tax=Paenibacillus provencensis TaxID=441151 RepID=A0ABW3Q4I8_9BACL|nr:HNH endonuclease [Paenibacillus sp. MER 78]